MHLGPCEMFTLHNEQLWLIHIMLYIFMGQKNVRIKMTLFILCFWQMQKCKWGHSPTGVTWSFLLCTFCNVLPFRLFLSNLSLLPCCHMTRVSFFSPVFLPCHSIFFCLFWNLFGANFSSTPSVSGITIVYFNVALHYSDHHVILCHVILHSFKLGNPTRRVNFMCGQFLFIVALIFCIGHDHASYQL